MSWTQATSQIQLTAMVDSIKIGSPQYDKLTVEDLTRAAGFADSEAWQWVAGPLRINVVMLGKPDIGRMKVHIFIPEGTFSEIAAFKIGMAKIRAIVDASPYDKYYGLIPDYSATPILQTFFNFAKSSLWERTSTDNVDDSKNVQNYTRTPSRRNEDNDWVGPS